MSGELMSAEEKEMEDAFAKVKEPQRRREEVRRRGRGERKRERRV